MWVKSLKNLFFASVPFAKYTQYPIYSVDDGKTEADEEVVA